MEKGRQEVRPVHSQREGLAPAPYRGRGALYSQELNRVLLPVSVPRN